MKQSILLILMVVLECSSSQLFSQIKTDWPQFLGPEGNSTSPQKNLLRTWPASGPEVLWTAPVGIGYGGPVVKEGKVYLLDREDKTGDILRCFDLNNGKELWDYQVDSPGSFPFPGSRSVPAINGNCIYACGAYGDVICVDINTHKPVWRKNIWTDFGGSEIPTWAITQCPLVIGDLVILAAQTGSTGLVAYDKLTGNVKWKTASVGPVGYVSPVVAKVGSETHIVMVSASGGGWGRSGTDGKTVGIDPASGKILWEYKGFQCEIPTTPAFDAGEDKILLTGGYNSGSAMIKVEKKSDGNYAVTELYKLMEFGSHTLPPVLYNGYFYVQYTTNERRDGLVCMSMDGKVMWATKRAPQFNKGSLILADGLILATDGFNKLYLIEPDPSAFKPLASIELLGQGGVDTSNRMTNFGGPTQNWAPTALVDGKLLIRDQQKMVCVKVAD